MEEHGCPVELRGEDIVNGVRASTLTLLWNLLSNFQVTSCSLANSAHLNPLRTEDDRVGELLTEVPLPKQNLKLRRHKGLLDLQA